MISSQELETPNLNKDQWLRAWNQVKRDNSSPVTLRRMRLYYDVVKKPWGRDYFLEQVTGRLSKSTNERRPGTRLYKFILEYFNGSLLLINLSDLAFGTLDLLQKHVIKPLLHISHLATFFLGAQAIAEGAILAYQLYNWGQGVKNDIHAIKSGSIHPSKSALIFKHGLGHFANLLKITVPRGLIVSALTGACILGLANFPAAPFLFTAGLGCIAGLNFVNFTKSCYQAIRYPFMNTPQFKLRLASQGLKTLCFAGIAASIPTFFFVPGAQIPAGVTLLTCAVTMLSAKLIKHVIQRQMQKRSADQLAEWVVNNRIQLSRDLSQNPVSDQLTENPASSATNTSPANQSSSTTSCDSPIEDDDYTNANQENLDKSFMDTNENEMNTQSEHYNRQDTSESERSMDNDPSAYQDSGTQQINTNTEKKPQPLYNNTVAWFNQFIERYDNRLIANLAK